MAARRIARAQQADQYVAGHIAELEEALSNSVSECMAEQPNDPVKFVGMHVLRKASQAVGSSHATGNTDRSAAAVASEWTAASWLGSVGIDQQLAGTLLGEGFSGGDELEAFRTLGCLPTDRLEDELFARLIAGLGPLVALLAPRLKALATVEAATSGEMQDKFSQETRGMLEYGNLNVFFGGLEALVGSPSPYIRKTMADEHTGRGDSARPFTTSNYDLRTTSATEWAFVATPDERPESGWPVEEKIRAALAGEEGADLDGIRKAGAHHRQPRPLAELTAAMDAKVNSQLRELREPEMIDEEALGLRLYTGPLFVKYNSVLRGLNSNVLFLQKALVDYCCDAEAVLQFNAGTSTYEQVKAKANLYTTTLHVINSGIVKTSKLTIAGKVYRGVSGLALPAEFWKPNAHGVRGGIEGAFMSTTTDRAVAMQVSLRDAPLAPPKPLAPRLPYRPLPPSCCTVCGERRPGARL